MKKLALVMAILLLFAGLTFAEETIVYEKIDTETLKKTTTIVPETIVKIEELKLKDLLQYKINLINEEERLKKEKADMAIKYDKLIAENIQRLEKLNENIAQIK